MADPRVARDLIAQIDDAVRELSKADYVDVMDDLAEHCQVCAAATREEMAEEDD